MPHLLSLILVLLCAIAAQADRLLTLESALASTVLIGESAGGTAGANAGATLSITTPVEIAGVGPNAPVTIGFSVAGMVGVKQFDLTLEIFPASAFNLPASVFAKNPTLFSISPGCEFPADNMVKFGAASFGAAADGTGALGTLTLTTAADFTANTSATIRVARFSLGPSSTRRDVFTNFAPAITVNPPAPALTLAAISPAHGPAAGGTPITISGTGLAAGAWVTIGGAAATSVTVNGPTSITAITPAGAEGAADVVVANPDARGAVLTRGFTYDPLVTSKSALQAASLVAMSKTYSATGRAAVADGSAGEVTLSVRFLGEDGAPAAGLGIEWTMANPGPASVFLTGAGAAEIIAGASLAISTPTAADGIASIALDAEGARTTGATRIAVTASTNTTNPDGTPRRRTVEFAVTWGPPGPPELTSFTGEEIPEEGVRLQWTVASQCEDLTWQIYRSVDQISYVQVGDPLVGAATAEAQRSYEFIDRDAPPDEALYYYLLQVDSAGASTRSEIIGVGPGATAVAAEAQPRALALHQNYPNPFNPATTISFDLSRATTATLAVYDASGQWIRGLLPEGICQAGRHACVWDGRDSTGSLVASGVYLYVLETAEWTALRRMILIR